MKRYIRVTAILALAASSVVCAFAQTVSGNVIYNFNSVDTMYYNGNFNCSLAVQADSNTDNDHFNLYPSLAVSGSIAASGNVDETSAIRAAANTYATAYIAANLPGYHLAGLTVNSSTWAGYNSGYPYWTGPATAPTSANSSPNLAAGASWTPTFNGGFGINSPDYFVVAGFTNWQTSAWTPSAPGTYTFYVAGQPASGFIGNYDDPIVGWLAENYTPYTLTLTIQAVAPTSSNSSDTHGVAFTPTYVGGSGGTPIWCVAGYTNWQSGSWTPSSAGTYTFYVATQCGTGYTGNDDDPLAGWIENGYTPYTLTVY
jgi:hypothetical protein